MKTKRFRQMSVAELARHPTTEFHTMRTIFFAAIVSLSLPK
jgi:hypothetical protein